MADEAHIAELLAFDRIQQAADAWRVHLDRDEVRLGMRLGNGDGRLAHARTDLQHERREARKDAVRRDRLRRERDAITRVKLLECPALRGGRPALAQDVATDRALQAALDEILPSTGELGAAA